MLTLTHLSLATTEQMFNYKSSAFELEPFPGYSTDQWGIKAHNRPWINEVGEFSEGQKAIEVGGAYSTLPLFLNDMYGVEAWVGDDFGASAEEEIWSRWGNPQSLIDKFPSVKYVFEPFGIYSKKYPSNYFDRIFSVSTLEHIPYEYRLDVFKDMNRCLEHKGKQLHSIDISTSWKKVVTSSIVDCIPGANRIRWKGQSEIRSWVEIIRRSGVRISSKVLNPLRTLDRSILVESPDVVYKLYSPTNEPKQYNPGASLLIVIEDT